MDANNLRAPSGRNQMFHHEGHEEHEEERGKEAFYNCDSPLRSKQNLIELAPQLSLRLRAFACNTSGRMHAKGDSLTAEALQRSKRFSLRALRAFVVKKRVLTTEDTEARRI